MNQDEQILNDLDEVLAHPDLSIRLEEGARLRAVERTTQDRLSGMEKIMREWLDAMLAENLNANTEGLLLIMRLGPLGNKLLHEAFTEGVKQGIKMRETQNPSSAG